MRRFILAIALILVFAVTAGATSIPVPQPLPDMNNTAMTIPWADFKVLLEKLQQQQPGPQQQPPLDYTLGRGELDATLGNGRLSLTAKYPLSILKEGWVMVPLVPTHLPLSATLLDGKTAPVTQNGGYVTLVAKGPAQHEITMRFVVQASDRPGPGNVSLQLPAAAGQVLSLFPAKNHSGITVDGATMSQEKGGPIQAILTGDNLTLRYTVSAEKQEEVEKKKLPPQVLAENSTLVSIDEGFIRAVVNMEYEVRHAPVTEFQVAIPEGYEVADCSGASLVGWNLNKKTRVLKADVGFEVKGAYSLTIVLERSTKERTFDFELPSVEAKNVERERGYFSVQVTGGVEVRILNHQGLELVDAKELPGSLRAGATSPTVLAFKYLQHPFAGVVQVTRHDNYQVLGAAIDYANYVVQITEDGDCVARALFTVRNNRKQFLKLRLPEGKKTTLWSSFVADKPIKPSKGEDGEILIPLERSGYEGTDLRQFQVEVIYYAYLGHPMRALGSVSIPLPRVDLPVSQSVLSVFAPNRYLYNRLSGSMRSEYYAAPGSTAPVLGFDGFGRVGNKAEFESSRDEDMAPPAPPAKILSRSIAVKEQKKAEEVFQTRLRAAQTGKDTTGALPARFMVPQKGTTLRFEELINLDEAPTLRLGFAIHWIDKALAVLVFLAAFALAWFARKLLAKDKQPKGKRLFVALVVAIVILVALGASVGTVIFAVVLALGIRLVAWIAVQIAMHSKKESGKADNQ